MATLGLIEVHSIYIRQLVQDCQLPSLMRMHIRQVWLIR